MFVTPFLKAHLERAEAGVGAQKSKTIKVFIAGSDTLVMSIGVAILNLNTLLLVVLTTLNTCWIPIIGKNIIFK